MASVTPSSMLGATTERRDTFAGMVISISVRLDELSARALRLLEASGMNRSEAVRSALIASADRARRPETVATEVAALERDEADRQEMREIAALMGSMRAEETPTTFFDHA